MSAMQAAQAKMERRAPQSLGRLIRREADRLTLRTEEQMAFTMLGPIVRHMSAHELMTRAKAGFAGERRRGREGHWSHDFNRMIAWAGIYVELKRRIVRAGGLMPEAA